MGLWIKQWPKKWVVFLRWVDTTMQTMLASKAASKKSFVTFLLSHADSLRLISAEFFDKFFKA